jgi:hypothetical protein
MERPAITQVTSAAAPPADPRITPASTLRIQGAGLKGPVTQVQLGEAFVPGGALTVSDAQISFALSAVTALRAGVQSLQVVHQVLMGEPEPGAPHAGIESNVAAFVLHPAITVPAAVTAASKQITVGFNPPVGRAQRVTLFLYEFNAPDGRPARAHSFPAPQENGITGALTETASITFGFDGVAPGDSLAYVQVDGAESLLGLDAAGRFAAPKVGIT